MYMGNYTIMINYTYKYKCMYTCSIITHIIESMFFLSQYLTIHHHHKICFNK